MAFTLFLCKLGFLGKDLGTHDLAYACKLNSCVHRRSSVHDVVTQKPEFKFFFFGFVSALTSVFYVASFSYVSNSITIFLPFNMFVSYHMGRLGFLNVNAIHSHVYALMP